MQIEKIPRRVYNEIFWFTQLSRDAQEFTGVKTKLKFHLLLNDLVSLQCLNTHLTQQKRMTTFL